MRFVIRKICTYAAMAIACLGVVLSTALLYRKYLQHRVAEERAIRSPKGINSLEPALIGGIEQWIEVRGEDVNNPILLFIHGGPGIAFIPLTASFQRPWEKNFTVVQWDQRGAGKTYASNDIELQRRTMNVAQMEKDTLEVVNYLRSRFKRDKIFVVGHSWGSVLGLWLAHEHPELIYAYVGVGQVVNMEQNDGDGVPGRVATSPKPSQPRGDQSFTGYCALSNCQRGSGKMFIANKWSAELLGPAPSGPRFTDTRRLLLDLVSAPAYSLADDYGFLRGLSLSRDTLAPELAKVDLNQMGSDFRVPMFFFEGRQDPYCRPSLIWEYSQTIKAPQKEFIWFDNSGHFPFFEEKQKFADELFQRIFHLAADRPNA